MNIEHRTSNVELFPKIDWHCHLLPGLDDGAKSLDESVAMATALRDAGFSTVHCTPHLIRGCYEADNAAVRRGVEALQGELDRRGIPLRLLPGREYYLDEFLAGYLKDPLPLGDTRFLLVEVPGHAPADFVKDACYWLTCSGYTPMIAHPERCRLLDLPTPKKPFDVRRSVFDVIKNAFNFEPRTANLEPCSVNLEPRTSNSLLDYLIDLGCSFQGNLGSFAGRYGERVRQAAERLREAGVYTHFGSDAHAIEHIRALKFLTAIS